jgi:glycyl-tRNA synthetase beta chain
MPDLLIELFSEEIPARMQTRAADDLRKLVTDGLVEAGLTYAGAAAFSTPRRLTLAIDGLTGESRSQREERKGPKVGAPDAAIDGFCRGAGIDRAALEIRDDKKGQTYFAVIEKPGRKAADIIAEVLDTTVRNFPWPKSMRWGNGSLRWVRPLQSIICLLSDESGAEVVPLTIDGITAGKTTCGHRFLAPAPFAVSDFADYEAKLKRAHVILRADDRAETIWNDAQQQAFALGLELVEDRGLLAEVAGLVEWPVVLLGRIGDDFLDLPPEVLQTSMKEHQKFFSVRNPKTGRIERFVTVANMETADQGATILAGNQKVLAARLSDAKFFWENDLRMVQDAGLEGMAAGLANVTFHNKLGSQADRIARIAALAREIAPHVGADPELAEQAAKVAKADLQSEMVNEFPELQGLMGRYYAAAAGLDPAVAAACQDHYSPLGPSDAVPTAPVSVAVALADKIDTLALFWAMNEKPTGSKDPFALRRATLGIFRLLTDNELRLVLRALVELSLVKWREWKPDYPNFLLNQDIEDKQSLLASVEARDYLFADLLAFFHDRLKVYLRDQGIRHDIIDACIAMPGNDDLTLLVKRARALAETLATDDGENLIQGFKRANNILTQAEEKDGVEYSFGADPKFAEDDAEKALFAALDAADAKITPAMQAQDFGTAMAAMAALRGPIDAFFTAVQINDDRQIIRRNRLNLLSRIRKTCLSVADLTKIEG